MASDIQFCTWLDQVSRFKTTCWNWNQPSMTAQTAQSSCHDAQPPFSRVHGQNATNGAVHAKAQMHQMGLNPVTCTNSESGRAICAGRKTGKNRAKEYEHPRGKDHPVDGRNSPLRQSKIDANQRPRLKHRETKEQGLEEIGIGPVEQEMTHQVQPCDAHS